jgi:hypothetical protein
MIKKYNFVGRFSKSFSLDTKTLDDKNAVHGEKSDFLGHLTEKIRGCGVSFYIWTKTGTQGELDWSDPPNPSKSCRNFISPSIKISNSKCFPSTSILAFSCNVSIF